MEKIKIELEGKAISSYVDDIGAIRSDKNIVYETESGHDGSMETIVVTKVAELAPPRILLGEFPVAVEIVLEEAEDGTQKILMLNLQDLLDKYHEEYDNAKA